VGAHGGRPPLRTWWSWLHELEATRLAAGEVWRCRVQPPLPYQVRFSVRLDQVVELQRVSGTVSGDVAGTASIELARTARGTTVHLVSSLVPRHPALRALSIVGGPMIRAGHDWVLDAGARLRPPRAESPAHVRPRPHRSRTH
jgi:hypothetical protein